ncbi:MAG: flavodoxin family protein [Candidatus Bipolaricaulis sp.]|nr:flavodoxin family protein [Candidatus Bipolaricaulis sp.]
MKTVVLKASPRKEGNTATLTDAFVRGLREAGACEIVEFSLADTPVGPCRGCNACLRPPFAGCTVQDGFQEIAPAFRAADVLVFASPIYWWHLCAQMKAFVDRMHPFLIYDTHHNFARKHLVLILSYIAEDPYGVDLVVRMFESITQWCGMGLDVIRHHAAKGPAADLPAKLEEAAALGRSLAGWQPRPLTQACALCRMQFPDVDALAAHHIMAAGEDHLQWKREHLSARHTLANTAALKREAAKVLRSPRAAADEQVSAV